MCDRVRVVGFDVVRFGVGCAWTSFVIFTLVCLSLSCSCFSFLWQTQGTLQRFTVRLLEDVLAVLPSLDTRTRIR